MIRNPIDFLTATGVAPGSLLVAALVLTLLPLRSPLWLRLASRVLSLVAFTLLVERVLGSPLHPQFIAGRALLRQQVLEGVWWIISARLVVTLPAQLVVVLENRPRETRIISDLMAGAIYIGTGPRSLTSPSPSRSGVCSQPLRDSHRARSRFAEHTR